MARKWFIAVALLVPVVSIASVPSPSPKETRLLPLIPLMGTTWVGHSDAVDAEMTVRFEPGGVLEYRYRSQTFRNGTWTQKGEEVYFETNKKYWEFKGRMKGRVITGRSWNCQGGRWDLTIEHQPRSPR